MSHRPAVGVNHGILQHILSPRRSDTLNHQRSFKVNRILLIVMCLVWATSSNDYAQSKTDPEKLARGLKGDNKGQAADNRQCKMFTKAEAGHYIGEVITDVGNAALGTGCQWTSGSDEGSMLVQVVSARYHVRPSVAPGYKKLPEVGTQAFVVPQSGGWQAGSLQGTHSIQVKASGKGATEAKTIELLKESMKRDAALPDK
jgi:hypothetical protein